MKLVRRYWRTAVWLLAISLVYWALSKVPLVEVGGTLGALKAWQLITLLGVNGGILLLFGVRWWLILRVQGYPVPLLTIARYRLAAFGISYFTPGPQFGGEPLQVYYLCNNHQVPSSAALASIGLDRAIELAANFSFLAAGIGVVFGRGIFTGVAQPGAIYGAVGLALLPIGYLALIGRGRLPATYLVAGFSRILHRWDAEEVIFSTARSSEREMAAFIQGQPRAVGRAAFVSAIVWCALVFEYWLALRFLGRTLPLEETIAVITAARVAFLLPFPGGVGALEAGQVLAAEALGYGAGLGASISVLIRARDVLFGLVGMLWGGVLTRRF